MPEIIHKSIVGVGFGFLHDEEIKKLSVKEITNSNSFDSVRQPFVGGLYDRAFGPLDPHDRCETCTLTEKDCPGHPGHIKLAVPIYNISLLDLLVKLLNLKCWNCHQLRASPLRKKSLHAQLLYLNAGQIIKARTVASLGFGHAPRKGDKSESYSILEQKLDKHIEEATRIAHKATPKDSKLTFHALEIRQKLIKNFILQGRVNKCTHCGAISPRVRRDGFTKIFTQSLSGKALSENSRNNIHVYSVLSTPHELDVADLKKPVPDAAKGPITENTRKKKAPVKKQSSHKGKKSKRDDDSEDDDDDDDDDIEMSDDNFTDLYQDANEEVLTTQTNVNLDVHNYVPAANAIEERTNRILLPNEVEHHLRMLWSSADGDLLSIFFSPLTRNHHAAAPYNGSDYTAFFHRVLLVPPSRFRPPSFRDGEFFESAANQSYAKIFEFNTEIIRTIFGTAAPASDPSMSDGDKLTPVQGHDAESRLNQLNSIARRRVVEAWIGMQHEFNLLVDSDKTGSALSQPTGTGIKQILEKKQGLFRKNMMGKRVNFAARSVISPDPYLHTREIGVPEIFARVLTYPEPVTAFNLMELRQAVINGPHIHPGANAVIDSNGFETKLDRLDIEKRTALANKLLSPDSTSKIGNVCAVEKNLNSHRVGDPAPVVVLRHLKNGDVLLANRQPTLHKPSMMAHIARVLRGENVLRMHYANCATYNADFDGDEMNLHFPQNQLARVEAYDIANNDNQYTVPTSGNPLRGLIQDHVVCGVRLTQRDTFLNQEYFQQFLFLGLADRDIQDGAYFHTPEPAILKPQPLWTGKQIMTSILNFIAQGRPPLNLNPIKTKVPASSWGKQGQEEGTVVFRQNHLVHGVMDKAMFGASKHGLVHAVYELYGARAAGDLLSIFGRLFTRILQYDGFTCGLEDMVLTQAAEIQRRAEIQKAYDEGINATSKCAGLELDYRNYDTMKINEAVQRLYSEHKNAGELIDNQVKASLNDCTSKIIRACLPDGQRIPFPVNNMSMMTLSGAKGSAVNHSQIACLLGQQELEGRRVPVTMTGKTLPSFPKYDPQPRAGGYISQRFFTGIKPQEYYFHCMAGREGLVDTAVKTARSGYLQRCIIKHLESLSIRYDHTVRDVDNSIVQFQYGEDAIDPTKSGYFTALSFLAGNFRVLLNKLNPAEAIEFLDCDSIDDEGSAVVIKKLKKQLEKLKSKDKTSYEKEERKLRDKSINGMIRDKDRRKVEGKRTKRRAEMAVIESKILDEETNTPMSKFPVGRTLGAVSVKFQQLCDDYIKTDPDGIFSYAKILEKRYNRQLDDLSDEVEKITNQLQALSMTNQQSDALKLMLDRTKQRMEGIEHDLNTLITGEKFTHLMYMNYMRCMAHPGENVGVVAGQSVGEPSTQMTLNTFHLAGHGGANVTLGIPRLREIVMTASEHIATPIMEIPILPELLASNPSLPQALAAKLNRIKLSECLQSITVHQSPGPHNDGSRLYKIRLDLKDLSSDWANANLISIFNISKCIATQLAERLNRSIKVKLRQSRSTLIVSRMARSGDDVDGEEASGDDENDAMTASERRQLRFLEDGSSDQKVRSKKKEQSTYDDSDEENGDDDSDDNSDDINSQPSKKKGKKSKRDTSSSTTVKKESSAMDDEENPSDTDSDSASDDSDDSDSDVDEATKKAERQALKKVANDGKTKTKKAASSKKEEDIDSITDFSKYAFGLAPMWQKYENIHAMEFDTEGHKYIDVSVILPHGSPKLLMLSIVEAVCEKCLVRHTRNIDKAVVIERKSGGKSEKVVQTTGVNFYEVWKHPEADLARIKCNDIHALLKIYGVEAARAAISQEISGVFAVYGIAVDPRHLNLIADYMTFQGGYQAMNRSYMASRPSVMQKATFETSLKFILDACMSGEYDDLTSPSSALVFGQTMRSGTNSFEIKQPISL